MKTCPNCNAQLNDDAAFCTACGTQFAQQQSQYAPPVDPFDHTAEFDAQDISDNKVISMLVYLLGWIGIIVAALLGANNSKYASFHIRQALKIAVVEILASLVAAILCWTFIVPIAYGILSIALMVIKFICFFQICSGQAKEPAIIKNLNFLK